MMHLRGLVLLLLCLASGARRSIRTNDAYQDAEQSANTLANSLEVSAEAWEALIPGSFGTSVFRRADPKMDALNKKPMLRESIYKAAPLFRFGPRRAKYTFMDETTMSNPTAEFDTTMGKFKAEIYLDRMPITASSFIDLCQSGFYDGIHFHRVIPGFMDQFGCPNAKDPKSRLAGTGGPPDGEFKNLKTGETERRSNGGNIQDEFISKDSNEPGTLSMANTGQPNSGGSQFFLNVNDNSNLDWFSPGPSKHPVFGKVTEGFDVAVAISKVPTTNDNPNVPIKMNKITITGL